MIDVFTQRPNLPTLGSSVGLRFTALKSLLGHDPASKTFSAKEMKEYIDKSLLGKYPNAKKPKVKSVMEAYLLKVYAHTSDGKSLQDAAKEARFEVSCGLKDCGTDDDTDEDDNADQVDDGHDTDQDDDGKNSNVEQSTSSSSSSDDTDLPDFEKKRRDNIRENQRLLAELKIPKLEESPRRKASCRSKKQKNTEAQVNVTPTVRYEFRSRCRATDKPAGSESVMAEDDSLSEEDMPESDESRFDVYAVFGGGTGNQPEIWYFIKTGWGRGRKIFYLDGVDRESGACKLNPEPYDVPTDEEHKKIRHVFKDVVFDTENGSSLNVHEVRKVEGMLQEYIATVAST